MKERRVKSDRRLKKQIGALIAFILVMNIMVPAYSEPVGDTNPEAAGIVTDPNAVPVPDPDSPVPGQDLNADPNEEAEPDLMETGLSDNAGLQPDDGNLYGPLDEPYDEYLLEDEGEIYTGPFDETEARIEGSLSSASIRKLIEGAEPGKETRIELNKDVSLSSQLSINEGKKITIDLKGHSLLSTGRGRTIRKAGFFGKYDIVVSGNETVLRLEDSGQGVRGRYSVSENNGIAVFNGAELEITGGCYEQADSLYSLASAGEGGRISVSQGTVSGNLDNDRGGIISLKGGKYSVEPSSEFLAKGHGYLVNKAAPVYRYEVRKKRPVYIKPEIEDGYVLNNLSLSECGIGKELYDESGNRIGGTRITGGKLVETDEKGKEIRTLSASTVFEEAGGLHYMTVKNDAYPNEIEISDAANRNLLLTDIFEIRNGSEGDTEGLVSFTSEDPTLDDLQIALKPDKELYYGNHLENPFDLFDVTYTHKEVSTVLDENSRVRFFFGEDEETVKAGQGEKIWPYAEKEAGSTVYVGVGYRGSRAVTPVTILKQPVAIVGKDVSSLVGEEPVHRYLYKVSVYPVDKTGQVTGGPAISSNTSMAEWTEFSSSVIDLTEISGEKPCCFEKTPLSDLQGLNEKMSRNYELTGGAYLKYTVEPSIILDFMAAGEKEPIADRRILEADSKSCIIGRFRNGKPASEVKWMVQKDDSGLKELSEEGISVKKANNGNGAVFSFDGSIAESGGGRYTIYEVVQKVKISGKLDEDKQLSVAPISPVFYDGNKFAASDDLRYFSDGAPKKGYSPILEVKVYDGGKKLEIGKDYVLSYKHNKKVPVDSRKKQPVVVITGRGDYAGAKIRAYFTIMDGD